MSKFNCFIPLVFLICFGKVAIAQNLNLELRSANNNKQSVVDSIEYNSSFKDYNSLSTEVDAVKSKLRRQGYVDTYLKQILKINDTLYRAELNIGNRIERVRIYYTTDFDTSLLDFIDHTKSDTSFEVSITALENNLKTLNTLIAEQGDPFSSLQLINIKKRTSKLISAQLKIISNQKRRIDKIVVKGYEKFPKTYIRRFLNLKIGKSFNLNDIKKKIELLEELRFANKIKDPEVLFTRDSTTLYIYVEKSRANNFDGFLGFGTNENTNKIEFDGYLDLRLNNNLNFGETLNLYYKSDEIDQQTFRLETKMPYLFKSPIEVEAGLRIFRKDSTFSNVNQYAKLNYQINARHKIGAGIENINSTRLLDNVSVNIDDYKSNYYTLHYSFIKPQYYDILFPVNFLFDLSSGFGNRDSDLGNQTQNRFSIEAFKIFNLNPKNSIYSRLSGAILNSDTYFDNELFRFGGINSVRGFEENSLVANLYGVINTEYRFKVSNALYLHSVIDAAYFENQLTDQKEKLFGFGFGLGLLTNSGLFRLTYASGKSENRQFRLSDSKVHVSLTATF